MILIVYIMAFQLKLLILTAVETVTHTERKLTIMTTRQLSRKWISYLHILEHRSADPWGPAK